jgi:aspartate/methionine/tyrosine aminotransferase
MWHINDLHGSTPVHVAELLSIIAFQKLDQIAAKQRAMLDENRRLLRESLESQTQLEYFWPEYGTIVFPRLKNGSGQEFCNRLRQDFDLSVVPGDFFEMPDRIRIGVGTPTESLRSALAQLAKALKT